MAQRVFVIWTNPIFQESVRLILNHPSVEWVGSTSDYVAARDQILDLQPNAILVEEVEVKVPASALAILEACNWDVRVIGLSLADNELSIYHREHQTVVEAGDLLQFVLG